MSTDTRAALAQRLADYAEHAERMDRIPTGSKYPHHPASVLASLTVDEARTIAAALRSAPAERGEGEIMDALGGEMRPDAEAEQAFAAARAGRVHPVRCGTETQGAVREGAMDVAWKILDDVDNFLSIDSLDQNELEELQTSIAGRIVALASPPAPVEGTREAAVAELASAAAAMLDAFALYASTGNWRRLKEAVRALAALPVQGERVEGEG